MKILKREIATRIFKYEHPTRVALSKKYPLLKKPIIWIRYQIRNLQNWLDWRIACKRSQDFFPCVVARHQSVLRRKLGDSNPKLQEQKIINLDQAIKQLNGIVIKPGQIFSFWKIVGQPTRHKGYVEGMLLSNGRVIEGMGGGLCQLSNFLYWIFLHSPTTIVERYHHSMDAFPDSGRTIPFGGGATVLYNFVDLKILNTSPYPLQLKLWLTNNHLKGQLVSTQPLDRKYHVFEKNHFFVKHGSQYYRYNELYREVKVGGKIIETEKITTNCAPVLYEVTNDYLQKNHFKVLKI